MSRKCSEAEKCWALAYNSLAAPFAHPAAPLATIRKERNVSRERLRDLVYYTCNCPPQRVTLLSRHQAKIAKSGAS